MTEEEWLASADLLAVVRFLHDTSARKQILFVVAFSRVIWEEIPNRDVWEALNTGERWSDEVASVTEEFDRRLAVEELMVTTIRSAFSDGCYNDPLAVAERGSFKGHLYEVFGNPFRPVAFDPAWRTTDVLLLARGIYEEKAFDRMPILADAL